MNKNFVLDTNILLSDYSSMFKFEENTVHIPMVVLEELDHFKKDVGDVGFNARQVSHYLDKLCKRGNISEGVLLNNGGTLFVKNIITDLGMTPDNQIIEYAKRHNAIVVSNDVNVRLKARILGLQAESHDPKKLRNLDVPYTGSSELEIDFAESEILRSQRVLSLEGREHHLSDNEFILLRTNTSKSSRLGRFIKSNNSVKLIEEFRDGIAGIKGKNLEQRYALDALMDPSIQLVTMLGKAGCGKTLIAVAAGLQLVMGDPEFSLYNKVIVARPIIPLGKDIGYLPGTVAEKMAPWMQPIYDNVDFLLDNSNALGTFSSAEKLVEAGILKVEPLTFIRGRSIPKQFMIIDEAQNLTIHEIKTIITRAGEGTKIVLTGDIEQIDASHLDSLNNGLAYVISKFRDQKLHAHITLTKGERSELAEMATNLL